MAKRINRPHHTDKCREKIKTSQLINRLQDHIFTSPSDDDFEKKSITPSQVKAIETLLNKTLPNLSSTDLNHEGGISISTLLAGMDEPNGDKET